MNNVEWPHFIHMTEIGTPYVLDKWKTLTRGNLHRRLGDTGSNPFTPAELSSLEFSELKGKISNFQFDEMDRCKKCGN